MDPNATVREMNAADRLRDLVEAYRNLYHWISRGGFRPTEPVSLNPPCGMPDFIRRQILAWGLSTQE